MKEKSKECHEGQYVHKYFIFTRNLEIRQSYNTCTINSPNFYRNDTLKMESESQLKH
jgi:hypothetical protein